jgi:hypothetical protein
MHACVPFLPKINLVVAADDDGDAQNSKRAKTGEVFLYFNSVYFVLDSLAFVYGCSTVSTIETMFTRSHSGIFCF